MIVRDEAHVIERCLNSVRPLITRWCIVDTGSRDATPRIIQNSLSALPGELHHRAWVNFGHNRTESLALARNRGDWLLLIDADEELMLDSEFSVPDRSEIDAWLVLQRPGGANQFYVPRLLRADHPWRYEGVLHEYLTSDRPFKQEMLAGMAQIGHFDSARNQRPQREKYLSDANVLEQALRSEPDNARNQFYLAQSLRDAGEIARAIEAYHRRSQMAGWDEEVYCSLFEIARLLEHSDASHPEIVAAYLSAWNARPQRAEPMAELARLHRLRNEHALALLFARQAAELPQPNDLLYVDASVYAWRARDELSIASYWAGDRETAQALAEQLLQSPELPATERQRIESNLSFFRSA